MQPAEKQPQTDERIASFVFQGTVMELHASTEPTMEATANTAILRVDKILYASEALQKFTGVQLTLHQAGPPLKQGQEAFFFADVLIYGSSLVVHEVEPRAESTEAMRGRLLPPDRRLQRRIKGSELIIKGEVVSIEPVEATDERERESEHDPSWAQAEVAVEHVLKGDFAGEKVRVLFPRSDDHLWYESPKFHSGQRGIWLLRTAQIEQFKERAHTALNPLDFQSEENEDRVVALL